jgi:uncharacterized protein (DUF4415 family)
MAFEWDEDNREAHLVKHGVDFFDVIPIFDDPRSKPSTVATTTPKPASTPSGKSRAEFTPSPTLGDTPTAESSARGKPMRENKERIARVSSDEARRLKGETDYARLDAMTDDDIAKAVADDPNAPPLDVDWDKASIVIPPGKDIITLRLDRDLLDYLRAQGKGYQTLINQVLRAWYDAQIGRPRREKVAVGQKVAEKNAAKKAAAKRPARKAAAKPAAPAKNRA